MLEARNDVSQNGLHTGFQNTAVVWRTLFCQSQGFGRIWEEITRSANFCPGNREVRGTARREMGSSWNRKGVDGEPKPIQWDEDRVQPKPISDGEKTKQTLSIGKGNDQGCVETWGRDDISVTVTSPQGSNLVLQGFFGDLYFMHWPTQVLKIQALECGTLWFTPFAIPQDSAD